MIREARNVRLRNPAGETHGNTAMAIGLLGRKVGMTQIFNEAGMAIPVTVIQAGPCHVLQLRTADRDGYEGVQLGFLDKPRVWPAAVSAVMSPSSTANARKPARKPASSFCPRPIASRSGSSANSAAPRANWPSASS